MDERAQDRSHGRGRTDPRAPDSRLPDSRLPDSRLPDSRLPRPPATAREGAIALLLAVLEEGRPLSEAAALLGPLAPPDRARAQRLAATTLRRIDRADRVLRPHLRKPPPAPLLQALRLAVVEMLCEGAPAPAVVNATVAWARSHRRTESFAGLVNAVLRRVAEGGTRGGGEGPALWDGASPQRLPKWLRGRLIAAYGSDSVAAMEAAHERAAPLDLTLRDPARAQAMAKALDADILPTGSLRRRGSGQVSDLPGFADGEWWVQDAAAAVAVRGLGLRAGERALDLCAAPGGKTLQMAAAGARVTALDLSSPRLSRLRDNLARTSLAAEVVAGDALDWSPDAPFDAILVDAPCTATGTIRRHPDLPFVRAPDSLAPLVVLQSALLDRALGWLAPGGRLVICTCSLLPEEGERQVIAALARYPGLRVDADAFALTGVDPAWRTPEGGLRLRPDYWAECGGMDGFYMAALRRA